MSKKRMIFETIALQADSQPRLKSLPPVIFKPNPPQVHADDVKNILFFYATGYNNSDIEVSINGGNYKPQPNQGFLFGDVDIKPGFFKGRIMGNTTRDPSDPTPSPAFSKGSIIVDPDTEVLLGRPLQPGSIVSGDSIANNIAAEDGKGFILLALENLAIKEFTNLAVSGATVTDQTKVAASYLPLISTLPYLSEDGINSFKKAGVYGYSNTIKDVISGYLSRAAMHFAKHTYFINEFEQSNTNGLIAVDQFLDTFGTRSRQARLAGDRDASWYYNTSCKVGDTIRGTVEGIGFAILYYKSKNSTQIQVVFDDITEVVSETGTNENYLIDVIIVDGLTNDSHNFTITALDSGKIFGIDCIVSLKAAGETDDIPMYVMDIPLLGDGDGLGLSNEEFKPTSNTEILRCSEERWTALNTKLRGRNFIRVKTNKTYDVNDQTQSLDKLHPLSKGHSLIANDLLSTMHI